MVKKIASFTFEENTIKIIELLLKTGKYRNKSHAVEEAIKSLKEAQK
jgi:Arc/MetJ-type ribon-helix-helix transcriptional regulator